VSPVEIGLAVLVVGGVLLIATPAGKTAVQKVRGKITGAENPVPNEVQPQGLLSGSTAQNRNLNDLHPTFRSKLNAWLKAAQAAGYTIQITETFRTPARQLFLFRQNRPGRWVTSKSGRPGDESMHQYGTASDIVILRNGVGIWDGKAYAALYKAVPPAKFGLEPLWGSEWVHLQIAGGYGAAKRLGIKPNVLVGSRGFA
jgi:hypothetical protein